jgi:hypothetical protein
MHRRSQTTQRVVGISTFFTGMICLLVNTFVTGGMLKVRLFLYECVLKQEKKNIYTGQIHQAHSVCNYLRLAGRHRAGRFANFYILHSAGDIFVSCAAFLYTILAGLPN